MPHPLDILEIVLHLTEFLSNRDLFACIQVSHGWHDVFLSRLWRHVHLKKSDTECENNGAMILSLRRHANLISTLTVDTIYPKSDLRYFELRFPRLQELDIGFLKSDLNDSPRLFVRDFLREHGSNLQSLTVRDMLETRRSAGHENMLLNQCSNWDILAGCSRGKLSKLGLRTVDLVFDEMDSDSQQIFLGLDTLILNDVVFTSSRSRIEPDQQRVPLWPHRLTGTKIRYLRMKDCVPISDQYQMLLDCSQELRSFAWECLGFSAMAMFHPPLVRHMKAGHWRNLESLSLRMNNLEEEILAEIIGTIGPLKDLVMDETHFGWSCTRMLLDAGDGKHRSKLESLSLLSCSNLQGSMVQEMLCSLPRLQRIRARELTLQSVEEDPRPWVCQELKDFRMALVLHSGKPKSRHLSWTQQTVFLDRLAALHCLEVLELRRTFSRNGLNLYYQELHLDKGLDRLRDLQSMRELSMIMKTGQRLGMEEAQWMVEHWPGLKTVYLSQSPSLAGPSDVIGDYFTGRGVKCYWKGAFPTYYNIWTI